MRKRMNVCNGYGDAGQDARGVPGGVRKMCVDASGYARGEKNPSAPTAAMSLRTLQCP